MTTIPTPEQRKEVYIAVKTDIMHEISELGDMLPLGLCWRLKDKMDDIQPGFMIETVCSRISDIFPEMACVKPINPGAHWWDLKLHEPRIEALDKMIEIVTVLINQ